MCCQTKFAGNFAINKGKREIAKDYILKSSHISDSFKNILWKKKRDFFSNTFSRKPKCL